MLNKILELARARGACPLAADIKDWRALGRLLFSPQGREFCVTRGFPDDEAMALLRGCKAELEEVGVYVDAGIVVLEGDGDACFVGETEAFLKCDRVTAPCVIVLLRGARARVEASGHAVVVISRDGESECEVINDGTAAVMS